MAKAVHVTVTGRVQGVGFRAFVARAATGAGIHGWVRNRRDGSVEAVVAGDDVAVEAVLAAIRRGPPASHVDDVQVTQHLDDFASGFVTLPTA